MNMVDMKLSPDEVKKAYGDSCAPCPSDKGPEYPWGLCIRLENAALDKLGITELPRINQEFHLSAVAMVTGVNADLRQGEDSRSVALQITMLQAVPEEKHPGEENETPADEAREHRQMSSGASTILGKPY